MQHNETFVKIKIQNLIKLICTLNDKVLGEMILINETICHYYVEVDNSKCEHYNKRCPYMSSDFIGL